MGFLRNRLDGIASLASWELTRLARRGQAHRVRLIVALSLLSMFLFVPPFWFGFEKWESLFFGPDISVPLRERARFGDYFTAYMLTMMFIVSVLLAPGYAAASLAVEKERKSLDLLLTTGLSDREIVLGKAAGRILFVMATAAAGAPIVMAAVFLGGSDPIGLVSGFVMAGSSIVLAGALGLRAAARKPDLRSALASAYGSVVVWCFILIVFPLMILSALEQGDPWIVLAGSIAYALFQCLLAWLLLCKAAVHLRGVEFEETAKARTLPAIRWRRRAKREALMRTLAEAAERARQENAARAAVPKPELPADDSAAPEPKRDPKPPRFDEDNPLLWRERWNLKRPEKPDLWKLGLFVGLLYPLIMFVFVFILQWAAHGTSLLGAGLLIAGVSACGGLLFAFCLVLSQSIIRERSANRLETLLCIPMGRDEFLDAKLRASMDRDGIYLIVALIGVAACFIESGHSALAGVLLGHILAGWCLVAGLGLWLSARARTEIRALLFLLPAALWVVCVPLWVWANLSEASRLWVQVTIAGQSLLMVAAGWWFHCRTIRALDSGI